MTSVAKAAPRLSSVNLNRRKLTLGNGIVLTLGKAAPQLTSLKLSEVQLTTESLRALALGMFCVCDGAKRQRIIFVACRLSPVEFAVAGQLFPNVVAG